MLILIEMLMAAILAYAAAATIIPLNVMAVILWLSITVEACRTRLRNKQPIYAAIGVACTMLAVGSVLNAAAQYKPSKTVEIIFDRTVSLESTELSLAQLDYYCTYRREQFPIRLSLTFADADKDFIVTWPSHSLTLREFIGTIESQTHLRHRFGHCGNGWTLLYGGDCSFGLSIRDTELIGAPSRPRKVYESGSYVPNEPDMPANHRMHGSGGGQSVLKSTSTPAAP